MTAASVENERNIIMIGQGNIKLVFTQIAGLIARRIVCWKKVGDLVEKGELVGLIRFGSRVDVLFPAGTEVTVQIRAHRVHGGSTPIGIIKLMRMIERRQRRRIRDRPRIQNRLSIIPSLFTIGNIFCGYYAVIATLARKLRLRRDCHRCGYGPGHSRWPHCASDKNVERLRSPAGFAGRCHYLRHCACHARVQLGPGSHRRNGSECRNACPPAGMAGRHLRLLSAARYGSHVSTFSPKKLPETGSKRYFVGLPIPAGSRDDCSYRSFLQNTDSAHRFGAAVVFPYSADRVSDDQHHPLLQLQGIQWKETASPHCALQRSHADRSRHLLFGNCAADHGYHLHQLRTISKLVQTVRRFLPSRVSPSEPAHGNIKT